MGDLQVPQPFRIVPFTGMRWEYKAIAAVYQALFDEDEISDYEARRSDEWQQSNSALDTGRYEIHRFIALDDESDEVIGYAQGYHTPWALDADRYHVAVRVHPDNQRQGVGSALHITLLTDLRARGAVELRAEVYETHENGLAFAQKRGWRELFRSWQFTLTMWRFDPVPFQAHLDRMEAEKISITTVTEEARHGTGWLPKLYALHNSLRADVPIDENYAPMPIERFAQLVGGRPESLPDAFFIAKKGDRYIGESYLQRSEQPDALDQRFTGVAPDARRQGIASALKLHAAHYALNEGYGRIVTWTESNNPAMVAINRKLGFTQSLGTVWYEQRLE